MHSAYLAQNQLQIEQAESASTEEVPTVLILGRVVETNTCFYRRPVTE